MPIIEKKQEVKEEISEEYFVETAQRLAEEINSSQYALGVLLNQAIVYIRSTYKDEGHSVIAKRSESMFKEMQRSTGRSVSTLKKYMYTAQRIPPKAVQMYAGLDYSYLEELATSCPWFIRKQLLDRIHDMISAGQEVTKVLIRQMIKEELGKEIDEEKEKLYKSVKGKIIITDDALIVRKITKDDVLELDLTDRLSRANGLDAVITIRFDIDPEGLTPDEYSKKLLIAEQVIDDMEFEPVEEDEAF